MFVIVSGVAGAGKDTIKKELMKIDDRITTLASYTDRAPRNGDTPGKTYNFVTTEQFEEMISNNEFYEYSKHHNHYYGTSKKLLNDKIKSGKIIIKDIDVNGTENLIKVLKDDVKVVTIFLKVPKDELERRLRLREDHASDEEIQLRLNRFEYEESKINVYDYVIKNDNLERTLKIVKQIIDSEYENE